MRGYGAFETQAEGVSEERDERCEMRDVRVAREKIMKWCLCVAYFKI